MSADMQLPEKAIKLLRLAVDGSAPEGEWTNAAVMFVKVLRKDEWKIDSSPSEDAPKIVEHLRKMKMPFGKHKGIEIRHLPIEYVEWMADNLDLKGRLFDAVEQELELRQ